MTQQDADEYEKAFGNRQYDWIGEDVEIEVAANVWAAAGLVPFSHGGIIGTARPGSRFQNHSNVRPTTGWKRNGGHYCIYFSNSTGGTTNATTLPSANNRKVSKLANERAVAMNARGAMSRAAAQEAFIKGGSKTPPPTEMPNVSVNYQIEVDGTSVNVRTEPTNSGGQKTVVTSLSRPTRLNIDREQQGLEGTVMRKWLRIADGNLKGRWIIERLTKRVTTPPPTPQPTKGTWSVQCVATRSNPVGSAYIDEQIARIRGMGYPNAFRHTGDGWCRARVPAGTIEQARTLLPTMVAKGFKDAFIVQNP